MPNDPVANTAAQPTLQSELLAAELWTYVHTRLPRFSPQAAAEVVSRLAPKPGDDLKQLAKRLRETMAAYGVSIKHAAALEAAARLVGHQNWHTAKRVHGLQRLQLTRLSVTGRMEDISSATDENLADWSELTLRLCQICDERLRKLPTKVLQVRFATNHILVGTHLSGRRRADGEWPPLPMASVIPLGDDADWLDGAHSAFEALRRHVEETGRAVLDGVAVLQLCHRYDERHIAGGNEASEIQISDVHNTELVLKREDYEGDTSQSFEIARGDELTCWAQLELACKDHPEESEIVMEGQAWRVGQGRYVWDLVSFHPANSMPRLVTRRLSRQDAERLLRRYRLAQRILSGHVRHDEVGKTLSYLTIPAQAYEVDLGRTRREIEKAGQARGASRPGTPP